MSILPLSRLRSTQESQGTWLSIGSPVIAELAAESGFDWLLFDLEHGCTTDATLLSSLQAIRGTNAGAIVRVGAPHPDLILRALDWGADGVMAPHITSADEAEEYLRAMHYPPRGTRGFSRSVRAYRYGLKPPLTGEPLPVPLFMAQIENLEGVKNVREIAQVDGVDVLFVGPADLSFDLTQQNEKSISFEVCLQNVAQAAREAGKLCGILVRNEKEIPGLRDLGYTYLAIDSDLAILRNGYQRVRALANQG